MKTLDEGKTIEISKGELQALCMFAMTDETRVHLNGIAFRPSKGDIFSTDGHRLLRWKAPAPFHGPDGILNLKAAKKFLSTMSSKDSARIELSAKTVSLQVPEAHSMTMPFLSEVNLPPAEQVVPQRRPISSEVTVNALLLSESLAVAKLLNNALAPLVTINAGRDVLDPVLIAFDMMPEWQMVVMPAHGNAKAPDFSTLRVRPLGVAAFGQWYALESAQ